MWIKYVRYLQFMKRARNKNEQTDWKVQSGIQNWTFSIATSVD